MKRLLFTAISVLLCAFASADDGWGALKLKEAVRDYVTNNLGNGYSFTIVSVDTIDHLKPDSTTMALLARISEYEKLNKFLTQTIDFLDTTPKSTLLNVVKMENPSVLRFIKVTDELKDKYIDGDFEYFIKQAGNLKQYCNALAEVYSIPLKVCRTGETDSTFVTLYASTHGFSHYECGENRPTGYMETYSEDATDAFSFVSKYLIEIIPLMTERDECWKVLKSLIRKQEQASKRNVNRSRR